MSKANGFQTDKYIDCMDISNDNRTLAIGAEKLIKLYSFDTAASYWFESKSNVYSKKNFRNENIRSVKWNKSPANRHLLAILFECDSFYITSVRDQDKEVFFFNMKGEYGYMKELIWVPSSKDQFFTGSSNNYVYLWNLNAKDREDNSESNPQEVVRVPIREFYNDDVSVSKIRLSPAKSSVIAVLGVNAGSCFLTIFDTSDKDSSNKKRQEGRALGQSGEDFMLLDWDSKGEKIVTSCNTYLDLWELKPPEKGRVGFSTKQIRYQRLDEWSLQYREIDKKLNILNLKWLKDKKKFFGSSLRSEENNSNDQILFSSIDHSFIKAYSLKNRCTSGQIVLNAPAYQKNISKWILDNNQEYIFVFMSKISKNHASKSQKLKIDKKGGQKQETKNVFYAISLEFNQNTRRIPRPVAMHLFNDLAFSSKNEVSNNCLTIFQEREETAIHLNYTTQQKKKSEERKEERLLKKKIRAQMKKKKKEKIYYSELLKNKSESAKKEQWGLTISQQKTIDKKGIKKNHSSQSLSKKPQVIYESIDFNRRSFSKIEKNWDQSSAESETSSQYESIDEEEWVMNYQEELLFLQNNYKIDLPEDKEDKREEAWRQICKHNCRVALQIGKVICAEFWTYLSSLTFPETEQSMTIQSIFEDMNEIEKYFEDNKIMVFVDEPLENKSDDKKTSKKPSLTKNIIQFNIEKQIQNLIDDNQLQTAVLAAVLLKSKDPKIISEDYLTEILLHYKKNLKDHGMIHWASKIAMKAGLTQIHDTTLRYTKSGQIGPAPCYQAKIQCGACHSYRNSPANKCDCDLRCVFCSQPLKMGMLVICKVCGHAGHIEEYRHYFKEQGNTKCPFKNCMHHCFTAEKDKPEKWKKTK